MKNIIYLFIVFFVFVSQSLPQDFSDTEKKILELQDMRSLGENRELIGFLGSKNDKTVLKTLNALANIADSTTVDDIGKILISTHNTEKRSYAAITLGQIPCEKSRDYLIKCLNTETESPVLALAMNSLGLIGDENSLKMVLDIKPTDNDVLKAKCLSMARFAIRKINSPDAVSFLVEIANSGLNPSVKRYAAYAFARIRNKELLLPANDALLSFARSNDEYMAMWAFSALGYLGSLNDLELALSFLNGKCDWKVKVNILNTLPLYKKANGNIINEKLVNALTGLYEDENPNVSHTALRITALLFSDVGKENENLQVIKDRLEWLFLPGKAADWQTKGEALLAYGTIFKDGVKNELLLKMSETQNEYLIPYIIKSFQFFGDAGVCRELTDSVRTVVIRHNKANNQESGEMVQDEILANIYRAYVEAISALKSKADDEQKKYIMLILTEFTGSKDPAILDICFTALNDKIFEANRKDIETVLLMDYKELSYPKDKDAIIAFVNEFGELQMKEAESILKERLNSPSYDICKAAANALYKITGKNFTFSTKPRTDFDWDFISKMNLKKIAEISTTKGIIKFEMLTEFTPFTVQNFIKLAEKKFYDNTIFHRIVPNFVIQGGDPQNSGYGGPEFSIRSEFAPFFYKEGAVGMASDGKDTEGSQFFIMHCPHYHLDGRYTLFGFVTEGQDVVDHIMPYDKIISINFTEN